MVWKRYKLLNQGYVDCEKSIFQTEKEEDNIQYRMELQNLCIKNSRLQKDFLAGNFELKWGEFQAAFSVRNYDKGGMQIIDCKKCLLTLTTSLHKYPSTPLHTHTVGGFLKVSVKFWNVYFWHTVISSARWVLFKVLYLYHP